jgi:subtilisin family serine protease
LRFEDLEERLVLTWAGTPPTVVAPTAAVSVTLNSSADATGTATIASAEVDYYTFTATRSGSYTFSATTPSSSLDTVLGVFSSPGQRLAYNDDISYPSNTDSRVTVNLTASTKYYIGITNYSSSSRGAYTWTIDGPAAATSPTADDSYENNDSLSAAYNLGTLTGTQTVSNLVMSDSADWFRFTTGALGTSANSVSISFQNSQGNLQLALYNSAGTLLATSAGTGNTETISLSGRAAGTYYIDVYGNGGATNASYSLTVNAPTTSTTSPTTALPEVAYYGGSNEWSVNLVNAPESWAAGYTGSGVVVAVVDTGVDWDHADLVNQIWVNADEVAGNGIDDDHNGYVDDIRGWDFASGDSNPDDANGHGTHVAGIIAADNNGFGATGVAPDATIMPIRVLGSDGSGTESAVAAGIRYAAANGADIINLSLGGSYSSVIYAAIQYAQTLDVLVVVASGNEYASTPSYPARFSSSLSNVLSVGAYSSSNSIASFSNDVGSSGAVQVDAPGVNVYSTYMNYQYATFSGTSMATPSVAGLAALALSANRALTASQLRSVIVNGANRTISGSDSRGGINAALTVALARAGQTSSSLSASTVVQSTSSTRTAASIRLLSLDSASESSSLGTDSTSSVNTHRIPRPESSVANLATRLLNPALVDLALADSFDGDATDLDGETGCLQEAETEMFGSRAWDQFGESSLSWLPALA